MQKTVADIIAFLRAQEEQFEKEAWKVFQAGDEHAAEGLRVQAWRCAECAKTLEKAGAMPVFERGLYPEHWAGYMKYSQNGPTDLRDFFPEAYR